MHLISSFLVCLDGLVLFLPSLLRRLRAICRPEQGKVGSRVSLSQLGDPFAHKPEVFVKRTALATKPVLSGSLRSLAFIAMNFLQGLPLVELVLRSFCPLLLYLAFSFSH